MQLQSFGWGEDPIEGKAGAISGVDGAKDTLISYCLSKTITTAKIFGTRISQINTDGDFIFQSVFIRFR
jgi:hypothetical protein